MDADRQVFDPGVVAIRGNEIVAVGPADALRPRYRADCVVDCRGHLVMPGLISTHTLPMSILRGLADDLRLDVWLHGYILPVEREFVNPEFCFLGATLACAEMLPQRHHLLCRHVLFRGGDRLGRRRGGHARGVRRTVMKLPPRRRHLRGGLQYLADFLGAGRGTN